MSRLTINSNILSTNAQRRFSSHTKAVDSAFTRLSSGLRINKASDDAAGLSVSSLLNADRRVTNQAVRNLNDGVSYLNVAESALTELTNIVTRIGELAEQGANGTLGNSQRQALQQEVTSLQSEYNRIIKTTTFNGNTLLTGLTTNTVLQGGYGVRGQLGVQVGEASLGIADDMTRAGLRTRVDTASDGTEGNSSSDVAAISADGRYVAFNSLATNLVSGDTNAAFDAFIKDMQTGETRRVSTSSNGSQANGASRVTAMSADGRYVGLDSLGTNLVAGDTNGQRDAFIKDLVTGETRLVSTSSSGTQGNGQSLVYAISDDGRYVVIMSQASNLVAGDTNGAQDVFVKDMLTGDLKRVSTSSNGSQGNGISEAFSISVDGRYVLFESTSSNLVAGDTNGFSDLFIKDLFTDQTTRVNTASDGSQASGSLDSGSMSSDGRYVLFSSSASNLVAGDTNGAIDAFIKDIATGITTRVSTGQGTQISSGAIGTEISADGRYITFISDDSNLVSGDSGLYGDAFIKDIFTGEIRRLSVDSSGAEESGYFIGSVISADGRYATYFDDDNGLSYIVDLSKTGVNEISGMVVSNQASARVTVDLAKKYIEELSSYKAGIGASLSRAQTFINRLQVQSENFAAASSQITDTDVAEEAASLTKTQILQQAAGSVLAQANQQPQLALRLLGGL